MTVNGPEGGLEWDAISWRVHEQNVARLRQRIFTAARDGDWPKVRSLQKMMLRSWSNTLVSVRQVTQRNAGRAAAGVDREVALDGPARMAVAVRAHQAITSWQPLPALLPGHREPTPILRLRYQGSRDKWAIGIYKASTGQYSENDLPGSFGPITGTPEQGIDETFILYAGPATAS